MKIIYTIGVLVFFILAASTPATADPIMPNYFSNAPMLSNQYYQEQKLEELHREQDSYRRQQQLEQWAREDKRKIDESNRQLNSYPMGGH